MALTPELKELIQKDAANLTVTHRPGMSILSFVDDHSSIIANTEKNLPALVKAGFDSSRLPYMQGCLEMLTTAVGDPTGIDSESEAKSIKYESLANVVMENKAELAVVCRSIVKNSGNRKVQQKFKRIMKGTGIIDATIDIFGLVAIIRLYLELAARIRPDGKLINEEYCKAAIQNATDLLLLKGYVIVNGVPQNNGTDFINRLITLCLLNQATIKEFAQAAFCKNPDYYKANFTSKYRKSSSDDDSDDLDEESNNHVIDATTVTVDETAETATTK
jgi:hypothetical protein